MQKKALHCFAVDVSGFLLSWFSVCFVAVLLHLTITIILYRPSGRAVLVFLFVLRRCVVCFSSVLLCVVRLCLRRAACRADHVGRLAVVLSVLCLRCCPSIFCPGTGMYNPVTSFDNVYNVTVHLYADSTKSHIRQIIQAFLSALFAAILGLYANTNSYIMMEK